MLRPLRELPPTSSSSSSSRKSVKPASASVQPAARPATPPPATTSSVSSTRSGGGKPPWRRRWPRAKSAPPSSPSVGRGRDQAQARPEPAAAPNAPRLARTVRRLAFIARPFVGEGADQRLVVEPVHRRRPSRHVGREIEQAGGDLGREEAAGRHRRALRDRPVRGEDEAPF